MKWKSPRRWNLVAIAAFAVPLIAIAFVQYRWLAELRNRSETIAEQQNREAAQEALRMLEEEMTAARMQVLPAVGHADLVSLELPPIAHVFEIGHKKFGYVDRFFVWATGIPVGTVLVFDPASREFGTDAALVARLPPEVWGVHGGTRRFAEFGCVASTPPCRVVVHRVLDDEDAELLGFAGFVVDLNHFAGEFLPAFVGHSLAPMVHELFEGAETPITFFDQSEQMVFGTKGVPKGGGATSVELPVFFSLPTESADGQPLWRLAIGEADDGRIEAIVRRGALGNLAVVGVGILALAIGTALMVRSSAREAKLSDLKSRFISGISHELKTPLSMIRLYSEMLELGRVPQDTERKVFYKTLRQQAELMGDMLESILDFSRLEAEQGSSSGRLENCSLKEILEEAVEMHDFQTSSQQTVEMSVTPELPWIRGNRHALVRVFYNLLDNASKYSGSQEPILLEAHATNGMVAIEVEDRGVGIPTEDLPHLFERFYRGQTPPGVNGTGLGLSIVQSVVASHGGKVEVQSEPGRGSRFTVFLPIAGHGEEAG